MDYLNLATYLAKQAGKLQMERLGSEHTIEFKGAINLVTEVDKASEELIIDGIKKHFPDHNILAEESGSQKTESDFWWIIDPLDGTTNYAHQFPFFCISIGLEEGGELIAGVIYDPNRDELFAAERGKGATLNGKPIQVSEANNLKESLLATGFAYNIQESERLDNLNNFEAFVKTARAVRRPGAAALDLAYVACGRMDGFWELFLNPWDIAAGALIIEEAGGKVTSFDGSKLNIRGEEILASNGLIHNEMMNVLARTRGE
jgi:myo-inositol-1(or 4)-monophosphatase